MERYIFKKRILLLLIENDIVIVYLTGFKYWYYKNYNLNIFFYNHITETNQSWNNLFRSYRSYENISYILLILPKIS